MIVLSRRDVEALLDLDRLGEALASAMVDLSEGRASVPARGIASSPDGILAAMPCYLPSTRTLESKLVAVFPGNTGLDTHQAAIVVFDPSTGVPAALMDGAYITAMRTAGGSALATRLLAREDASVLAILGTGVQARSHARMLRGFSEVRVAGRNPAHVVRLASSIGAVACASFEDACDGADVVCAATHSREPVVHRSWLRDGAHVNSVGFTPGCEVDASVVTGALVAVESRAAALGEHPAGANDLAWPIRDGLLSEGDVVEIGELISGRRAGRTSPSQITLYKSVGVAVQDAAAAALVLDEARRRGIGTHVEL